MEDKTIQKFEVGKFYKSKTHGNSEIVKIAKENLGEPFGVVIRKFTYATYIEMEMHIDLNPEQYCETSEQDYINLRNQVIKRLEQL